MGGLPDKLQRYALDGRLNIDNNRVERAIKPFVTGRKAWFSSQTANGANASTVLYSIVEQHKQMVTFCLIIWCIY